MTATTSRAAGSAFSAWVHRISLLRESPVGMIGAFIILFWIVVAIFAPILSPYDPNETHYEMLAFLDPSAQHWLGLDSSGRDVLSRIIWGSRTVLIVAPLAVAVAYFVGCTLGLLAGYYIGWVDVMMSRITNIILSIPPIVLFIIIITLFGPSVTNVIIAVTLIAAPQVARLVRGITLELRERDFVAAAKMRGEGALYIMVVEILPNARGPLIVDLCLRTGYTIIQIGVLGFLGLGLPPPTPDWGGMVNQGYALLSSYPHMAIFPCIAISSLVIGFNFLADGMREIGLRD
ncbi:MAG: ABC transporter permease [Dongiaceae bacterium]